MTTPVVYSLDEVAERLHKTRRWLQDFLRSNRAGLDGKLLYRPLGRDKLFTDDDICRIDALVRYLAKPTAPRNIQDALELLPTIGGPTDGVVYFVLSGDFIKIGHSRKWPGRLSNLQTASPQPLSLLHVSPGSVAKEKALHRKFRHLRAQGEWFQKTSELTRYIDMLKADGA